MKTLLLLSILGLALVSAELQTEEDRYTEEADVVAVDDSAEAMDNLDDTRRSGWQSLTAKFEFGDALTADIKVTQSNAEKKKNNAKWSAKFTEFNDDICPGGQLNWHVHQYPVSQTLANIRAVDETGNAAGCGSLVTGGHYDPTFACGGASQNKANGICAILRATDQDPAGNGLVKGAYACTTTDQSQCEIGDQSGKMGKLDATKRRRKGRINGGGKDYWMEPIANLEGKSMVLHCCVPDPDPALPPNCGARLACANLE